MPAEAGKKGKLVMGNYSTTPQTLHEFQKNANEVLRFSLSKFKSHQLADIRVYYQDDQGEWRPTKKGISLSVDLVEELTEGVRRLQEAIHGGK